MSTIAIAGGTGQLGRALVDALVAQGKYKVIVLAREVSISLLALVYSLDLYHSVQYSTDRKSSLN